MKKVLLALLITPFLFACNKTYSISLDVSFDRYKNTYKKYSDYNNVESEFIYFDTTYNTNDDVTKVYQFGYDIDDKLFYEYSKENNVTIQKWSYFENSNLIILTNNNGTKSRVDDGVKETQNDKYFVTIFQSKIIEHLNKLYDLYYLENKTSEKYEATSDTSNIVTIGDSNNNEYCYDIEDDFINSIKKSTRSGGTIITEKNVIEIKNVHFKTSVDKDEYK